MKHKKKLTIAGIVAIIALGVVGTGIGIGINVETKFENLNNIDLKGNDNSFLEIKNDENKDVQISVNHLISSLAQKELGDDTEGSTDEFDYRSFNENASRLITILRKAIKGNDMAPIRTAINNLQNLLDTPTENDLAAYGAVNLRFH